jgi:predicted MPP superfamily phosphohydrolase
MPGERIHRRSALKLIGAGTLGVGLTGLFGYTYAFHIEPHWLAVERVYIQPHNLPTPFNGFKLVCLSDFHHETGDSLAYIRRVVKITNDMHPDVVCLLGDYVFSQAGSIDALASVLSDLEATSGVYAVLGNHDYWTDPKIVQAGLQGAGIEVLINQRVFLERAGEQLLLIGLDDGWSGDPEPQGLLEATPADIPVIVLMHEPDFADSISKLKQVDLQLSGHSHGGQVKPLFVEAPMRPDFARKYIAGLYEVDQMILYVTRGIGVIPPRARFNCRPEITEIVLTTNGS